MTTHRSTRHWLAAGASQPRTADRPADTAGGLTRRQLLCAAGAACTLGLPRPSRAQADAWVIGQTAALSGALAWPFVEMNKGIKAAFHEANDRGGVAGRPLRLVSLDDGGVPEQAAANARQLVEQERAFTLFACGGTTSALGAMSVVNQAKIALIAPATGADSLRAHHPLVIHTRASYSNELAKIVQQIGTTSMTKCAVAYFDNPFGKATLAAFDAAAKRHQNTEWKAFLVPDSLEGIPGAVDAIAAFQPASLISLAVGPNGIPFYKALRQKVKAAPFSISFLGTKPLLEALGEDGKGITVAQVVPHPESVALPLVKAYQAAMRKVGQTQWTYSSLEGYVAARVLIEGLRRAGRPLPPDKFIEAFHTMRPLDLGGLELNYSPKDHQGTAFVELTYFTGDRYRR